jgi:hypothetical protein
MTMDADTYRRQIDRQRLSLTLRRTLGGAIDAEIRSGTSDSVIAQSESEARMGNRPVEAGLVGPKVSVRISLAVF